MLKLVRFTEDTYITKHLMVRKGQTAYFDDRRMLLFPIALTSQFAKYIGVNWEEVK